MSEREYDVHHDRVRYELPRLNEADFGPDPVAIFRQWLGDAAAAGIHEPNAMVVATATPTGVPRARTVLLRGVSDAGFVFFTNYESTKGQHLAANPKASACFGWLPVHRQVIIDGDVQRVDAAESDAYFASRPVESQIASATSPQSQVIDSIEGLLATIDDVSATHPDGVERPAHWGGYRIVPSSIEFWQGNVGRLHDRFRYRRDAGAWLRERLAP